MTYKIEICGNQTLAGSDARALERLTFQTFETEKSATQAVDALAASWFNPQAIWDIVSIMEVA